MKFRVYALRTGCELNENKQVLMLGPTSFIRKCLCPIDIQDVQDWPLEHVSFSEGAIKGNKNGQFFLCFLFIRAVLLYRRAPPSL